jgi:hypothetical protein
VADLNAYRRRSRMGSLLGAGRHIRAGPRGVRTTARQNWNTFRPFWQVEF